MRVTESQESKLLDARSQARNLRHLVSRDTFQGCKGLEAIPVPGVLEGAVQIIVLCSQIRT